VCFSAEFSADKYDNISKVTLALLVIESTKSHAGNITLLTEYIDEEREWEPMTHIKFRPT